MAIRFESFCPRLLRPPADVLFGIQEAAGRTSVSPLLRGGAFEDSSLEQKRAAVAELMSLLGSSDGAAVVDLNAYTGEQVRGPHGL